VLARVQTTLREMGFHPTSRLKTVGTIIEKLVRDRTRLSTMQDIAGVRIVEDVSLDQQDEIVATIQGSLGGTVIDRRRDPTHGYRAVHIVTRVDDRLVEIQVRTRLQNLWAQLMETLADRVGRGIRYGEAPADRRHRELVDDLKKMSKVISEYEALHARRDELERSLAEVVVPPTRLRARLAIARSRRRVASVRRELAVNDEWLIGHLERILGRWEEGDLR
jgi:ppGpp synthetase/RelA/SpoT-type nucleotidyltranferase